MRSIVIVGGGTAGWMTAASLAKRFPPSLVAISLVESSQIGTIGVGEATVPLIRDYVRGLGLDMSDVMRRTSATIKLGIMFEGWSTDEGRFFHPFGQYGVRSGAPFHQVWQVLADRGEAGELAEYNLGTQLALAGRFRPPPERRRADLEAYDWALHFDASRFAAVLRDFAIAHGVHHIDARVTSSTLRGEDGFIEGVHLDDGRRLEGDLFIDCSGTRALLLQEALKVGYTDWKAYLPCDRAVALPCENREGLPPYTKAIAQVAGWRWRIPLQHRVGNGYVFDSDFMTPEQAESELRSSLEGPPLAEANHIRFRTGHANRIWEKNCVGIGLAAGFLEPLESTSISLIQTGVERLITLFPQANCNKVLQAEYNRISHLEYERIRDFLVLHYIANRRDEPFWAHCRNLTIPESLKHRIDLFRTSGYFVRREWDTFFDASWLSLYEGFGWRPDGSSAEAATAGIAMDALCGSLHSVREAIRDYVERAETHENVLAYLSSRSSQ